MLRQIITRYRLIKQMHLYLNDVIKIKLILMSEQIKISQLGFCYSLQQQNQNYQNWKFIMIQVQSPIKNRSDEVEISFDDWKSLHRIIKSQNFDVRLMKKNIIKYEDSIAYLVEAYPHQKRFSKHLKPFQHKFSEINQQFKVHVTTMYKLFNYLHLQEFTSCIEFLIDHLLQVEEFLVGHLEQKNKKIQKMERQLDQWRIIKSNSMCFTCKGNVQQSKIRNLALQIGSTFIDEKAEIDFIDRGHQIVQIQKQCRNIQFELNQMGEESFFNEESANLIQMINELFKMKLNNFQKIQKRQNTCEYLQKYLKDINQSLKPAEIIDTHDIQELLSDKKMASSNRMVTLKDLTDSEKYINKLKILFSQPIRRFIQKYSSLLQKKKESVKPEMRTSQTQTSLIKQNQMTKKLEKSYNSMEKQLNSIKQSKQKNQKELIKTIESLQKNELKLTQLTKNLKSLQNQNKLLTQQNKILLTKYSKQKFQLKEQIQSILDNSISEKNQMNKKIKDMQFQMIKLSKLNYAYEKSVSKVNNGTQCYSTFTNLNDRELKDTDIQTEDLQLQPQQTKVLKKSMLKTLKSLKYKLNKGQQNEIYGLDSNSSTRLKFSNLSKTHNKTKSALPFDKTVQFQSKRERQVQFTENSNIILESRFNIDEIEQFASTVKTSQKSKNSVSGKYVDLSSSNLKKQSQKRQQVKEYRHQSERKPSIRNLLPPSSQKITQKSEKMQLCQDQIVVQKQVKKDSNSKVNLIKSVSSKVLVSSPKLLIPLQMNKKSIKFDQQNLKKVSKNVFQTKNRLNKTGFSHNKNVKSMLSSPSIQNQLAKEGQFQNQPCQDSKVKFSKRTVNALNYYDQSTFPQNNIQKHQNMKKVVKFINQNFDFLNEEGIIDLLKEIQIHKENLKTIKTSLLTNNQLSKMLQKVDKFHIDKKDLELFFSMQEASKFQKNMGLWTDLDNCIMVDTNFAHLAEDIDKYFQELKQKSKITYNQYFLFVDSPATFFKEIFNQDKNRQKAYLLKYTMKGIKPKHTVKDIFRKLIRLHKMLHKNCNHIQKFLDKIGFKRNDSDAPLIENRLKSKNFPIEHISTNIRVVNTGARSHQQSMIKKF